MLTWRTVLLTVILAVTVTAGSLWLLMWQPSPPADADQPQQYPIQSVVFTDPQQVEVTVVPGSARAVNSPVNGTVTATQCTTGKPLTTGTVIAEVNQQPVIAIVTQAPLFRDLVGGERGADVEALQQALREAGFDVQPSGWYDWATRTAVDDFLRSRGFVPPQGQWGTLAQTAYVWAPASGAAVASCPLQVGDSVAQGSPLITLASSNGRLEFVSHGGVPGDRVLVVADVRVPASASPVTDPAAVSSILATAEGKSAAGSTEKKLMALLELATPLDVFEVPPSALFGTEGALACVSDGDDDYAVTIVSSSLGMTYVTFDSEPPAAVDAFADPATTCG